MNQLITLTPETQRANQTVVNEIFRLRHRSFLERLGWEVTSTEQMECDDFDRSGASYVALKGQNNDVVGCWRALPTQGRYMLKDVFPNSCKASPRQWKTTSGKFPASPQQKKATARLLPVGSVPTP